MQYKLCKRCGAHLDYGEECDCEKAEQPELEMTRKLPKSPQEEYIEQCWREWYER